jgi:hypothetical protein
VRVKRENQVILEIRGYLEREVYLVSPVVVKDRQDQVDRKDRGAILVHRVRKAKMVLTENEGSVVLWDSRGELDNRVFLGRKEGLEKKDNQAFRAYRVSLDLKANEDIKALTEQMDREVLEEKRE